MPVAEAGEGDPREETSNPERQVFIVEFLLGSGSSETCNLGQGSFLITLSLVSGVGMGPHYLQAR